MEDLCLKDKKTSEGGIYESTTTNATTTGAGRAGTAATKIGRRSQMAFSHFGHLDFSGGRLLLLDDHSIIEWNNNRDANANGHHLGDSDSFTHSDRDAHPDDFCLIKYFTDADDFAQPIGVCN